MRFYKAKVDDDEDDSNLDAVIYVELPADRIRSNGIDIVSGNLRGVDNEKRQRPSFRADLVCADLNGIDGEQIEPDDGVECLKDEYAVNHHTSSC